MSKRESAKYKIDRRMGENIWGRPKSPVNKREYGPGQHGQRRKCKLSDFGLQLRAKQKLKGYYGDISEKQFRKIYEEADRRKGDTSENLIGLLESRLDAIVYRAKFVPTIFAARQFVNHGHVSVNGSRVNIPSYRCKAGDVIEVREKSKQLVIVLEVGAARRARRSGLHRRRPQQDGRHLRPRPRPRRRAVRRCRWNRTWWSNSTRANRSRQIFEKAASGRLFHSAHSQPEADDDALCPALIRSDLQALVDDIHRALAGQEMRGKVADYIPQLATVDPSSSASRWSRSTARSMSPATPRLPFSIQSISKVFTLTLALGKIGDGLWNRVGREPSGTAFNSIVQLEHEKGMPRNPFINAGAIAVADLVLAGHQPKEAIGEIVQFVRFLADDESIAIDHKVARSETETGFRNFALANFMRSFGKLNHPVEHVLGVYFHQCALAMSCRQLANAGLFLAAGGRNPLTGGSRRFARPGAAHQRADADVRPL